MCTHTKALFLFIINLTISPNLYALKFEHLSVADGLSQSVVLCILQDSKGFMWFGTEDGLNKYDAYKFTVYKHEPDNPNSLTNNYVWSIFEDHTGILWIATGHGLDKFDPAHETFVHYRHDENDPNSLSHNDVRAVYEDHTGTLWVGTLGGGLNQFVRKTEKFVHYQHDENNPHSLSHNEIYWSGSLYEDSSGTLWIGTYGGGLNKFDRETKSFVRYQHDANDPNSLSNNTIFAIYEDSTGSLWIGTDDGLNQFDRETFVHYLDDHIVNAIYEKGVLWIGTDSKGLYQFNSEKKTFVHYQHDNNDPHSLSNDYINIIYQDNTHVLWIGTWGGGLNKVSETQKFRLYQHHEPHSLSNNAVWAIYEDSHGILWIGTEGGGLNKFDRKTEKFVHYQHEENNPNSLISDDVYGITEDQTGALWIGTWEGLSKFDPQTEKFMHYQHDENNPNSLSHNNINSLYKDKTDILWIGTWGSGLDKFDPKTDNFTNYRHDEINPNSLSNDQVNDIYEDSAGVLWIGTLNGLDKFDRETFVHYQHDEKNPNSLSGNHIYAIYEDSRGILWIGTAGSGLNKFDRATGTFTHYYAKDGGIPNDTINKILEDDQGNLWLSTNKGLSKFDPQTNTFRNYYVEDGLQSNEFFIGSACKTRRGELLFGGGNGFNLFHPEQLKDNPHIPPLVITDFQIFNQPVKGEQHISFTKALTLSYQDSVFSFEFAALNYTIPQKNQYAYKMEGFDNDWIYVDSRRRFATYTNLDAGDYVFKVKGSNNDGVWNEAGTSLKITITPPWWETTWFRAAMFLLIAGLIAGGFRWRVSAVEAQKRELEIQVAQRTKELSEKADELEIAKQKAELANQTKSAFLANMSHELRSPLNAILGFAQIMNRSQTLPQAHRENIGIINRSGEHLLMLINQVLDLSKIEAGRITLNKQNFDFYRLLDDVEDMFQLRADDKHLQLLVERSPDIPQYVQTDEVKLRQVLINLLNNAIKFTQEGGVSLRVSSEAGALRFEIEDTGPGIAPDELENIFEAFVQTAAGKQAEEGTGLGLPISRKFVQLMGGDMTISSGVGKGTTFKFEIAIRVVKSSDIQSQQTSRQVIALAPGQSRYRILIVDDKPSNRQLLLKLLGPLGFEVRDCCNGVEAIEIWEYWQPHLIWMDMRMPVMDGYEATQRIKATLKGQATTILALTASAFEEERAAVLSAGCDDFMRKPFKEADIFEMMHKHIGVRYIYEEPTAPQAANGSQETLTPATLATLPPELVSQLAKVTLRSDMVMIDSVIEEIRTHNAAIADALSELANDFKYEEILALI